MPDPDPVPVPPQPLDPDIRRAAHQAADLPQGELFRTSPADMIDLALDAVAPLIAARAVAAERENIAAMLREQADEAGRSPHLAADRAVYVAGTFRDAAKLIGDGNA